MRPELLMPREWARGPTARAAWRLRGPRPLLQDYDGASLPASLNAKTLVFPQCGLSSAVGKLKGVGAYPLAAKRAVQ